MQLVTLTRSCDQRWFAFIEAEWSQRFPATLAIFMQFVIETHFLIKVYNLDIVKSVQTIVVAMGQYI